MDANQHTLESVQKKRDNQIGTYVYRLCDNYFIDDILTIADGYLKWNTMLWRDKSKMFLLFCKS